MEVIRLAHFLVDALRSAPSEIGLTLGMAESENCLIFAIGSALCLLRRGNYASRRMKARETIRQGAPLSCAAPGQEGRRPNIVDLPSVQTDSFRLLGLQLDRLWTFREHRTEAIFGCLSAFRSLVYKKN